MINKVWAFFVIVGITFGIFNNQLDNINQAIIDSTTKALELSLKMIPMMGLWVGIMKIAEVSKLFDKLTKIFTPIFSKLFPEIPKGHESLGYIASNIITNLFGLGSAATPFGLKAMESLQKLNKNSEIASNSMVTFLVLNTGGLTIIPTTVITLRMMYGSNSPTEIIGATLIATITATIMGLIIDRFLRRSL